MDTIGGLNVVTYPVNHLWDIYATNPEIFSGKKGKELFAGMLLNEFSSTNYKSNVSIGFPLKIIDKHKDPKPAPPLKEMLINEHLIEDTDYDIVISDLLNREKLFLRLQISYIPAILNVDNNANLLYDILEKKFKYQKDKSVALLIIVENDIELSKSDIKIYLKSRSVPFGKIFVIGLVSSAIRKYGFYELYPEFAYRGSKQFENRNL